MYVQWTCETLCDLQLNDRVTNYQICFNRILIFMHFDTLIGCYKYMSLATKRTLLDVL